MCKRIFDITLALLGLLVGAPLMAVVALAVYLDSPGPVIFSQERLGRGSKRFRMHKFRKFPANWGTKGPGVTTAGDVRMTRVGRLLERIKFDELPQLWNILLGQMSFVGPRPESLRYSALFEGDYLQVLDYLPGIFGPNQVAFRNESAMYPADQDPEEFYRTKLFPEKAAADVAYFSQATCLSDFVWIVKGVWVSLIGAIPWRKVVGLHIPILLLDLLAIEMAWLGANLMRFGSSLLLIEKYTYAFLSGVWLFPLITIPILIFGGVYRHPIRHFSITDVFRLIVVASTAWLIGYFVEMGFIVRDMSIAMAPLGLFILIPAMIGPRIWRRERWRRSNAQPQSDEACTYIMIYGTDSTGTALAMLFEYGFNNVKISGFIDDDDDVRGRYILGYKVHGSERDLDTISLLQEMDQLWLTFTPDEQKLQRLHKWANKSDVEIVVLSDIEQFKGLATSYKPKANLKLKNEI